MAKFRGIKQKQREKRDATWPDANDLIWYRKDESGFCTVPRTLMLIGTLIKILGERTDASRVYIDLWMRNFDDGMIEVRDQEELATSCGYRSGNRGIRTWRAAIALLEDLEFVRVASKGSRKYGYILLLHPHDAVEKLKEERPNAIPDWWWSLFTDRVMDIGATLRLQKRREEELAEHDDLPF